VRARETYSNVIDDDLNIHADSRQQVGSSLPLGLIARHNTMNTNNNQTAAVRPKQRNRIPRLFRRVLAWREHRRQRRETDNQRQDAELQRQIAESQQQIAESKRQIAIQIAELQQRQAGSQRKNAILSSTAQKKVPQVEQLRLFLLDYSNE
jgi:hypothetical protein